jgi:hypothetical protein
LQLERDRIEDARDIHRSLMTRYADRGVARIAGVGSVLRGRSRRDQHGVVAGRVSTRNAEPRPAASVAIVGTTRGAIADANGRSSSPAFAPAT